MTERQERNMAAAENKENKMVANFEICYLCPNCRTPLCTEDRLIFYLSANKHCSHCGCELTGDMEKAIAMANKFDAGYLVSQLFKGLLPDEGKLKPKGGEQAVKASCDGETEREKEVHSYLGEFPSSKQYKFTTPGRAKSRMIMNHMALSKTILHHLSINEPFRLTIEYEPEELNSTFKIESDHECPDKLNI